MAEKMATNEHYYQPNQIKHIGIILMLFIKLHKWVLTRTNVKITEYIAAL